MTKIKVLAETEKTVTLRRTDFRALLAAAENNADLSAVERRRAEEKRVGLDVAKRGYLSRQEAERLIDGESPVRVWREKRGMTQRALADAAQMAVSYLAEIEGGKKPGSHDALSRLAQILEVPTNGFITTAEPSLQPVARAEKAAARLAELAEKGGDRARLAAEAREIVQEWLEIATAEGARHQVKAAVGALEVSAGNLAGALAESSLEKMQRHELDDAQRLLDESNALRGAVEALHAEYRRL